MGIHINYNDLKPVLSFANANKQQQQGGGGAVLLEKMVTSDG